MERHRLGDATLVRLVDGRIAIDPFSFVPTWSVGWLAPSADEAELAFAAYGLEVDGLRIVVDPWLVTDGARAAPDAGQHADRLAAELTTAGFPPRDVDVVVLSHVDGIGWSVRPDGSGTVPTFPHARYLLTGASVAAVRAGTIEAPPGFDALTASGQLDEVALDEQVSPSVRLAPAEGHTPGHVVVRLVAGDTDVVLSGHLVQTPEQVADPAVANDTDPEQATAERRRLLDDLAATGGWLFGQLLGGTGGGRVVSDGDGHRLAPLPD